MCWRQAAVSYICLACLVVTAACSPRPQPTDVPAVTPPAATTEPAPSPTLPAPEAAATPACTETQGQMETRQINSASMPAPLRFIVYLPPCYTTESETRYPVLYLFHGQTYDETQWVRLGVAQTADRLISAGEAAAFMIVLPFDPYPNQPHEYGFDEALVRDLLPEIDQTYRTFPDREHRAIGGLSRGSSWALHFGLSRPELFGRFGMHSPVIFASDGLLVEKWLDIIPAERMPQIYLDVSENDQNLQNAFWLEGILTDRSIPHEWHLYTGFHTDEYWASHVEEYLRWYASAWELAP